MRALAFISICTNNALKDKDVRFQLPVPVVQTWVNEMVIEKLNKNENKDMNLR